MTFAGLYAEAYDAFYELKDYPGEVLQLETDFLRARHNVDKVLDLGCGTGRHAEMLSLRHDVVGVDQSAELLEIARRRAPRARFVHGDLAQLDAGEGGFDAAVAMYAVLGYLAELDSLVSCLLAVHRHLREGGLLAFDVWHAPAVYASPPVGKLAEYRMRDGTRLMRTTRPRLDVARSTCELTYELLHFDDRRLIDRRVERHRMRFFTVTELELLLMRTGFEPMRFAEYPNVEEPPNSECWYVSVLARRGP